MRETTLVWTALPHGIVDAGGTRELRLSVFVSIRLRAAQVEARLDPEFTEFLDWPARLQPRGVDFDVVVDGRDPVRARVASEPPRSDLWKALFNGSTFVRSYEFDDLTGRAMSSNKMAEVQQHVKDGYQRVAAASPVRLPTSSGVSSAFPLRSAFVPRSFTPSPGRSARARHLDLSGDLFRATMGDDRYGLSRRVDELHELANTLAGEERLRYTPVVADDGSVESHFAALVAFHHQPDDVVRAAVAPPRMDFHDALTSLADYPLLLPMLGLSVELRIPLSAVPQSQVGMTPPRLRIVPRFAEDFPHVSVSPFTAYRLDGDRFFLPAARTSDDARPDVRFGFLDLAKSQQFQLIQIDVDGAGLKTLHAMMGQPATAAAAPAAAAAEATSSVPALRTSGVALVWSGQDRAVHQKFTAASLIQERLTQNRGGSDPGRSIVLFSEDLVRGYRVDVRSGDGPAWRSLHRRIGTYEFTDGITPAALPGLSLVDEGMVQHAAAQKLGAQLSAADRTLRVQDSIAHWQGWGLSVRRPGKSISGGTQPEHIENTPIAGGFPLKVKFDVVAGSLPRLRFGMTYQLRARAVDLAGNGWTPEEADALFRPGELSALGSLPILPQGGAEFTYRRFEPVPAPVLVARSSFTEGEAMERLVLRSTVGVSASAYASQLSAQFGAAGRAYSGVNERHVVPPKCSLWVAETHGLLDASFGRRPGETDAVFRQRCDATYRIASKESGTLLDEAVVDSKTGASVPIPPTDGTPSVVILETNPRLPDSPPVDPKAPPPARFALHRESQLRMPYLPDPLAHGAAFFDLPGVPPGVAAELAAQDRFEFQPISLPGDMLSAVGSMAHIPFGPAELWPERMPFRLQIFEPARPGERIEWDATARVLRVPLAKAESVRVRLSSYLRERGHIDLLGMWKWMQDNASSGVPTPSPSLAQVAVAGAVWMLTPYREIELVHAVQRPLRVPNFISLKQRLADFIPELLAAHTELQAAAGPADSEIRSGDLNRTFALLMGEVEVHGKSTSKIEVLAQWKEPEDTPEALWKLASAGIGELTVDLPSAHAQDRSELQPFELPVTPGTRYIAAKEKLQFSFLRHEFSDTRHRVVRYQARATTRFRDCLPAALADDPAALTVDGDGMTLNILSRARPAVPKVKYVLPTFGWSRPPPDDGGTTRHVRSGNGVRVYLDRPWFSSGGGELLGVVLAPPALAELLAHCSTQWGRDPVWESVAAFETIEPRHFARAAVSQQGLLLDDADAPGHRLVTVVGHAVQWDASRQLWYCDIEIDVGASYFPFVRLALVRHQPNSTASTHISRVVLADFVQLAPERKVTVSPVAGNADRFHIRVEGPIYASNSWREGSFANDAPSGVKLDPINQPRALVQVQIQERVPGTADELGWQSRPGGIEIASAVLWNFHPEPSQPLWEGRVTLPGGRSPGQFRVQIIEAEHFVTDHIEFKTEIVDAPEPEPDEPPPTHPPPSTVRVTRKFYPGEGRIVFADAIEL